MWMMIIILTAAHKTWVELPVINNFSLTPPQTRTGSVLCSQEGHSWRGRLGWGRGQGGLLAPTICTKGSTHLSSSGHTCGLIRGRRVIRVKQEKIGGR